jgi:putative component of toxin-antitoxin plasmid stabilization module
MITVGIYISSDNKKPFSLWHEDLYDIRARAKIDIAIARLQLGRTLIILLCGGDKRSQKKDILKAKEYWQDYMTRKKLSQRESGHEKKNKR